MKLPRNWNAAQLDTLRTEFLTIDYLPDLAHRLGKSVPAIYYIAAEHLKLHRAKRIPPPKVAVGRLNAVLIERSLHDPCDRDRLDRGSGAQA